MDKCDFKRSYYRKKDKRCYHCGISLVGNDFWKVFDENSVLHPVCDKCSSLVSEKELEEMNTELLKRINGGLDMIEKYNFSNGRLKNYTKNTELDKLLKDLNIKLTQKEYNFVKYLWQCEESNVKPNWGNALKHCHTTLITLWNKTIPELRAKGLWVD